MALSAGVPDAVPGFCLALCPTPARGALGALGSRGRRSLQGGAGGGACRAENSAGAVAPGAGGRAGKGRGLSAAPPRDEAAQLLQDVSGSGGPSVAPNPLQRPVQRRAAFALLQGWAFPKSSPAPCASLVTLFKVKKTFYTEKVKHISFISTLSGGGGGKVTHSM